MTDAALFAVFGNIEMNENLKWDHRNEAMPTWSEESVYKLFVTHYAGITDPKKVHSLWKAEKAIREARKKEWEERAEERMAARSSIEERMRHK